MDTTKLIENLAKDAKPVRPLPTMSRLYIGWTLAAGFMVALVWTALGFRNDVSIKTAELNFVLESFSLGLFAFWTAFNAMRFSVPGADDRAPRALAPLVAGAGWLILVSYRLHRDFALNDTGALAFDDDFVCALLIFFISLAPNILLFRFVRRAYPLKPALVGVLAGASSAALAAFGLQFICGHGRAVHIFTWHLLPILLSGAIGGWLTLRFSYDGNTTNNPPKPPPPLQ